MEKHKVVFHINESNKWNVLLANVNNLIKDLGKDNIIIEVLANGASVVDFISNNKNSEFINKMSNISEQGVNFSACRNSLIGNNIEENLIPNFITVVSAGVTELIKKQSEGYAYIKP